MAWPVLPACPSFGFSVRADYSVTIIERSGGVRSVNRNWYYPLLTFTAVPIGDKPQEDIHTILRFWHAIGGQAGRFLFKDYTDFRSSIRLTDPLTPYDQPLVYDASVSAYRMVKLYEDQEFEYQQQRIISHVNPSTLLIGADGAPFGGGYSIDQDTGLITGLDPPATDSPEFTWGGEFWVPVMFETVPEFMVSNKNIQQTSFALREIRL